MMVVSCVGVGSRAELQAWVAVSGSAQEKENRCKDSGRKRTASYEKLSAYESFARGAGVEVGVSFWSLSFKTNRYSYKLKGRKLLLLLSLLFLVTRQWVWGLAAAGDVCQCLFVQQS